MIDKLQVDRASSFILERITEKPIIGVILGSGLGSFEDQLTPRETIPTLTIPHYPTPTVQGHRGKLIFGRVRANGRASLPVSIFSGRVHFYESADLDAVVFPVHVASALGVKYLLVTNAAGGIGADLAAGDLMMITDFINLSFLSLHLNIEKDRKIPFVQTANRQVLNEKLQVLVRSAASDSGIELHEGTYCWLRGPSYETRAEIEMLRRIGVDAVGMSTVPELMAADELGIKVAGISLISNLATGITSEKLSHDEVTEAGKRVKGKFAGLLQEVLLRIEA